MGAEVWLRALLQEVEKLLSLMISAWCGMDISLYHQELCHDRGTMLSIIVKGS